MLLKIHPFLYTQSFQAYLCLILINTEQLYNFLSGCKAYGSLFVGKIESKAGEYVQSRHKIAGFSFWVQNLCPIFPCRVKSKNLEHVDSPNLTSAGLPHSTSVGKRA